MGGVKRDRPVGTGEFDGGFKGGERLFPTDGKWESVPEEKGRAA